MHNFKCEIKKWIGSQKSIHFFLGREGKMKKIISIILCAIILMFVFVLPGPMDVKADEDLPNEYYVNALCSYSKNSSTNIRGYYYDVKFKIDKKLCGYYVTTGNSCKINLYVYDENGYEDLYENLASVKLYSKYSVTPGGKFIYGDYKYEYDGATFSFHNKITESENKLAAGFQWSTAKIEDSGFVNTNIPYFATQEQCLSYMAGEISNKKALNYESNLCDIKYDLEIPKNLKIKDVQNTGASGYFLFTWEQTDPNYKNWQTEIYRYVDFKYRDSVLIFSWADWKYVDDYYVGQNIVDTYKLSYKHSHFENLDDKSLSDRIYAEYPTEYGGVYKYGDEKVYIRNYYFDGTYKHYSNWIIVELDSEEGAIINPDMNSTVVEQEGTEIEVDDDCVVKQPVSNIIQDSE